ncbi:Methionine aminopeptidase 2 [compost metagenome]
MAFAIEPMVNIGGPGVKVLGNKWTVVTKDKSWSAHFEHSVLATPEGPYILTREEGR